MKQSASKLTVKGQVTIPKKIRDDLKVAPGDSVLFVRKGKDIVLKPVKTLLDCKGTVKSPEKIGDWEDVRRKAREHVVRKVLGSLE